MNEFLEQFLIESREQVTQATDDLLMLEKDPQDKERLDSAFRAFHTLKGGAAIVDFHAMASAVHAAEEVLADVRAERRLITGELIGDCLACIDQILRWLDRIESRDDIPDDAQGEAARIVKRFSREASTLAKSQEPATMKHHTGWISTLLALHPKHQGAQTALRYQPTTDCFFNGVDPLALIQALPGLLALEIEPAVAWDLLDVIDPFACNLVIRALLDLPATAVLMAMRQVGDACAIESLLDGVGTKAKVESDANLAKGILKAQIDMLGEPVDSAMMGRLAAAGQVAANVFFHLGQSSAADAVSKALQKNLLEPSAFDLLESITACLEESSQLALDRLAKPAGPNESSAQNRTLRIDVARVNALVDLTGELTVSINAVAHDARRAESISPEIASMLRERHAELERLLTALQQSVLAIRVLPLRHVFQRFPRLVREIAAELDKPINLVVEGADTEADKAIVEMLFEPLLHVLRNAADHGIEAPAARATAGKASVASIFLRALREDSHVVVEVADDGAGIDVARVREIALARGLLDQEALKTQSEEDIIELIFEPGFTTSDQVTSLSGRGVGMDAVRSAIAKIGGSVSILSRRGEGTTVRFQLPFSVMMTRVMMVQAGGQWFGVPLDAVSETMRIPTDRIRALGASQAVVLRERTVPVIALHDALQLSAAGEASDHAVLVVTKSLSQHGALWVDAVGEPVTVMLKPLEGLLANTYGLAGSTLLGDGSVLLILDLVALFQ